MKFRNFLRILVPVCALTAVSCTNEELVLDASQTQRGRDFAQAFEARFGSIDPNHTWVDGTVGKVTVTTDEKANIVIYALGFNGNNLLKLKHTVVDGTAEVKYDIPLGAKDIVLRAYNNNGNEYKTLDPSNSADEVVMALNLSSRANKGESIDQLNPRKATKITNVWGQYGNSVAPWQTVIPEFAVEAKLTDHQDGRLWDWNFFYEDHNIFSNQNYPFFNNFISTNAFNDLDDFLTQTSFKWASSEDDSDWQIVEYSLDQYNNYTYTIKDKNGNVKLTGNSYGTPNNIGEGTYYNFKSYGKRGSWWSFRDKGWGEWFTTNLDLQTASSLADADFYTKSLYSPIIEEAKKVFSDAEDKPTKLGGFCRDAGFKTLQKGEVSITWFNAQSSTRDYIGYYYTKSLDKEDFIKAPKYLLLDGGSNSNQKTMGATFPMTYYGDNYDEDGTFEFPSDVYIHLFIVHGNGSSINGDCHPLSNYTSYNPNGDSQWLFKDPNNNNEWTLNAWVPYFSTGGEVTINEPDGSMNDVALTRLYNDNSIAKYLAEDLEWVYYPTVAFSLGGYNFIGFEDWPYDQSYGGSTSLDWNDCTFILNGSFDIKSVEEELEFALCLEDLGGTDDLDYNDLYMTVKQPKTILEATGEVIYDAPKFTVHQVGGTLPLKIDFTDGKHDQTLFEEIHGAYGMPTNIAINTTDKCGSEPTDISFTSNGNDGVSPATIKCASGLGSRTATLEGFDEEDANTYSIIENASAITVTVTYDDNTTNVEGDQAVIHIPTIEEQKEGTQKVPYAFIIPKVLTEKDASGKAIDNSAYDTFTPPTERVYIGFKYPSFKTWVANQNANNSKWYYFHWGASDGTDNSEWDAPSQGGGQGGGGDTPTNQFVEVTEFNTSGSGFTIPASYFANATTKAIVRLTWAIPGYTWTDLVQDNNTGQNSKEITGDGLTSAKSNGLTFNWYSATPPVKVEVKCE